MTILVDKDQGILSPALVPALEDARGGGREITIGLINNMPDPALKATERQFMKLLQAAAGRRSIRFQFFRYRRSSARRRRAGMSRANIPISPI